jgi:hypothetical protein
MNQWKTIAKEIDKEGGEYFGDMPGRVSSQLAAAGPLCVTPNAAGSLG